MAETIFSKIVRGEIPCHKLYEDEHVLAFLDVAPLSRGHTLVIPKDPAQDLHDADPAILGATIQVVQTVAAAVKQAFDAPGIMIAQLSGAAAGQTVFHIHFHILPRSEGVQFKLHAREVEDAAVLEAHAERIRACLARG